MKTKNTVRKYNCVKDINRNKYVFYDEKTGELTPFTNPVIEYWQVVDPGHETKCTIQDFSGMTGKSANDVYEALIKKGADPSDVEDTYNYLKKNNYYLDVYGVKLCNGRAISFDGRITADDVLKIYCSITMMDDIIYTIHKNSLLDYDKVATMCAMWIGNSKEGKNIFAKMLKETFKSLGIKMDSESVIDEYYEFVLPYACHGFKCPASYDYYDNYVTENKAA